MANLSPSLARFHLSSSRTTGIVPAVLNRLWPVVNSSARLALALKAEAVRGLALSGSSWPNRGRRRVIAVVTLAIWCYAGSRWWDRSLVIQCGGIGVALGRIHPPDPSADQPVIFFRTLQALAGLQCILFHKAKLTRRLRQF
jgi:hypothetical protein